MCELGQNMCELGQNMCEIIFVYKIENSSRVFKFNSYYFYFTIQTYFRWRVRCHSPGMCLASKIGQTNRFREKREEGNEEIVSDLKKWRNGVFQKFCQAIVTHLICVEFRDIDHLK